ncbi:TonB family protein [Novosphingobium sp. G106]|uniref:energy transducer TonB n=1 Tax=Novosphingobium sp. G106 TaxID=2849500 RepID=UPI001C2D3449|nr:energy transducer TonB [Novosphingobium sp. G106]MBV1690249.1 TonB family protein [Novosphingobium sp. G106]
MAYIDQRSGRNQRIAAMTVVAVLQGAVIVALINGLAVHWRPGPPPTRTEGEQINLDPIPTPPLPPKPPIDQKKPIDQPQPRVPLGESTDRPLPPVSIPSDPIPTQTYDPPPLLPKPPVFEVRAPKPKNAPGSWATPNDYPSRDLREGNQGVTGFALTVGADGHVQSCTVTASSGFPGLDKATCDNVSRRARFEPATDSSGNRTVGTYSSRIRWQIPQG